MDTLFIRGLDVDTIIGIYTWERKIRQRISIDLDVRVDITRAANTDDVRNAVDYKVLISHVANFISSSRYQLLETLSIQLMRSLFASFAIDWVRIHIEKVGAVRLAHSVGLELERSRENFSHLGTHKGQDIKTVAAKPTGD